MNFFYQEQKHHDEGYFFFSSRRRHTRWNCDWSSDVCSSDLSGCEDLKDRGAPGQGAGVCERGCAGRFRAADLDGHDCLAVLARTPCGIEESIRVRNGFDIAENHPQAGLIGAIVDNVARLAADLVAARHEERHLVAKRIDG